MNPLAFIAVAAVPEKSHAFMDLVWTLVVLLIVLLVLRMVRSAEDIVEKGEDIRQKWDADRTGEHHHRNKHKGGKV